MTDDPKYKIIFIPGSRGGYVISYESNTLSLVKALDSGSVQRGLYLNDYFYMVSDTGVTSYKEGTWDKMGEVIFEKAILVEPTIVPQLELPHPNTQASSPGGTLSSPDSSSGQ